MQLIRNRLQRVDIYSPSRADSGYVGTKSEPTLLGYVYADIMPVKTELSDDRGGKAEKKTVKLILRPDAGVKCGDLAAVFGGKPCWEITEVKKFSGHISVKAEKI